MGLYVACMKQYKPKTITMKTIILTLLSVAIISCGVTDNTCSENRENYRYNGGLWNTMEYDIEEVEIDYCEYIIIFGVDGRNIIHKANCKNSYHVIR